jgi:hypothetical protein
MLNVFTRLEEVVNDLRQLPLCFSRRHHTALDRYAGTMAAQRLMESALAAATAYLSR